MSTGTRRRGGDLEAAIYDAVFEQLQDVGYRRLTMEGVATAARTGKAALYRRWNSKDDLISDALRSALPEPPAPSVHDDVRSDLLSALTCFRDAIDACRGTAFKVLKESEGQGKGILHDVVRARVTGPVKDALHEALVRGAERGDVRPGAATRQVAEVGPALIVYHNLTDGSAITDAHLAGVVDGVLMPIVRP